MADSLANGDLLEEWAKIVGEYEKVTKQVLSIAAPSTPQDLEARCHEFSRSDRSELVKTAAMSVFKVAEFAVEASSIFSPATYVFTALAFLGDTIAHYRSAFMPNAVLDQLKGVGTYLGRMEGYLKLAQEGIELDARLRDIILTIFAVTLRLCTTYTKVAQDSKRVIGVTKNVLKAAIRWDNGIGSRLNEIKEVSDRELNHNVAALRVSDIYANDSKTRKANAERLKKYLAVGEGKERNWTGRQAQLEEERIQGMGEWLFQLREFQSWADAEHHTDTPVLYLNAASGYGKSYLCAQAIWFLKTRMKTQQQQQPQKSKPFSVASYFFPEGQAKGRMNKRGKSGSMQLLDALHAVVWQLAEADGAFQDFVVKAIEKSPQGMAKPDAVWTDLLNEYAIASKQDSGMPQKVLFLVLDGYGEMDLQTMPTFTKIIKDVTQHSRQQTQFRILLAGNQDFSQLNVPNISEIGLSRDHQRQDAKLFIEASLKGPAYEHWDHESEEHRTLLGIRKDLALNFEGDYHELKEYLQEVERSSERGLLDLQELQGTNLKQQLIIIKRKLEMLNNELESNDIEVLNELIACMVYWKLWPSVAELNAYLMRRLGKKFKPPIESQLKEKFARLARVENGFVYAWKLRDFFIQTDVKLNNAAKAGDDGMCYHHHHRNGEENVLVPKCMMDLLFTQPPADTSVDSERLKDWVKQYERLKEWVKEHTISRPVVRFDLNAVKLSTIKGFLQSICDNAQQERAECKNLFPYVAIYLPAHLSEVSAKEIASLGEEEKQSLGSMLYRAFMDEKIVETWLPKGTIVDIIDLPKAWEDDVENVVTWLEDRSVRLGFRKAAGQHSESSTSHNSTGDQTVAPAGASDRNSTSSPTEAESQSKTEPRDDAGGTAKKSNIEDEKRGGEMVKGVNRRITETAEEASNRNINVEEVVDRDGSQASDESSDTDYIDALEKLTDGNDRDASNIEAVKKIPDGNSGDANNTKDDTKAALGPDSSRIYLYELLHVPAKVVATQWFQDSKWGAMETLMFLSNLLITAYQSKRDFHGQAVTKEEKRFYDALFEALDKAEPGLLKISSPEAVKAAEKWALYLLDVTEAQSHRNTTHDLRLAETFMALNSEEGFEEAERRCELIKAREPLNIKAQLSLIDALDCSRNRKRQALEELMKIRHNIQCASFKEADENTWTAELHRFWSLCRITNSAKEAFIACHHLSEEFPEESFPLDRAQEWIERQTKLDSSFEIISMTRRRDGRSLLSELFCLNARSEKFHQKFHAAAKDRSRLVLETYEEAISTSKQCLDTEFLRYHYGVALSRCGRLRDAMIAWEKSVGRFQDSKTWSDSPQTILKSLYQVVEALGSAYLGVLLDPKRSESPNGYIEKLELYRARIDDQSPNSVNYLALLLARAYLHIGQAQKAVSSVEKHMSTAFSLLEDDKPDNDWNGYFMLAEALTSLEDDDNARAAWSLIVNVPDLNRTCELSITCAGGCGWVWDGSTDLDKDLYICRNCPHVRFESECRELLSKNGLKQHICGANHSLLTVRRRMRSEVRTLEFNQVLVGKAEMKIDDWLNDIRRRYGIPSPQLGWPSRTVENLQIARWKMRRQTGTLTKGTLIKAKNVLSVRK